MSMSFMRVRGKRKPLARLTESLSRVILRLLVLAVLDAFAIWFFLRLINDGVWPLATIVFLLTIGINVVNLKEDLYPLRWLSPGLGLLLLMALYPILFTVYTAFTNYSDGHLLTKQQLINLLARQQYLPEGAPVFSWTAYRSEEGEFALWLTPEEGNPLAAFPGEEPFEGLPGEGDIGSLNANGVPSSIRGYQILDRAESLRYLSDLDGLEFGVAPSTIAVRSLDRAEQSRQRYVYSKDTDSITDEEIGTVYFADKVAGVFISAEGNLLSPGYQVPIGIQNFERLFTSPALSGPFLQVFLWTLEFAFFSVLLSFALGLFLAMVFNDPGFRLKKMVQSILIIPYAIPGVISVLIWRGMLNPHLGVVSITLESIFGWSPAWFSDPLWTKIAITLVNMWLTFPYMMLISSGALQSIPNDLYEAAELDGAGVWDRFRDITLPLLLISLGPLLIASFAFSFNNFNVIYLFNEGGPPIPNTPTPAGHTDILISYTYRLAFAGHRGSDYGYAAAISFVIFILISIITLFNFRYTRIWEEISENV
jgi:arabinogalactan oligomer / maltooligosaccharide transport system permease protein